MDMSAAYVKAAGEAIPAPQTVHDRSYMMQLATTAADKVRRAENRELKQGATIG